MTTIAMAGGPEFDRIRAVLAALGSRAGGLGSDVGWLTVGGVELAVSTDVSVEGVHFRREWLSLEEIGWRAAAAALSDLAAAGAEASGLLAAVTLRPDEPTESLVNLMRGADAACAAVGGRILGGDLSRGEAMALAMSVIGTAGRRLSRQGARPGDGVWVTGALGGARAALAAWNAGRAPAPSARARFARPAPRIAWGRRLADAGATAMLDLSDGLAADAGHLAAASGVALRIRLESLPLDPAVAAEARAAGEAPAAFAARGGEDYELLVTLPAGVDGVAETVLTRIGTVEAGTGVRLLLGGRAVALAGYDHFA